MERGIDYETSWKLRQAAPRPRLPPAAEPSMGVRELLLVRRYTLGCSARLRTTTAYVLSSDCCRWRPIARCMNHIASRFSSSMSTAHNIEYMIPVYSSSVDTPCGYFPKRFFFGIREVRYLYMYVRTDKRNMGALERFRRGLSMCQV